MKCLKSLLLLGDRDRTGIYITFMRLHFAAEPYNRENCAESYLLFGSKKLSRASTIQQERGGRIGSLSNRTKADRLDNGSSTIDVN